MFTALFLMATTAAFENSKVSTNALPKENPGTWINREDYPVDAWIMGKVGTTAFTLTIGPDGRVERCEVTASSGVPSLDDRTCVLLKMRAAFTPASNAEGQPVGDTYSSRVVWRLPAQPPIKVGQHRQIIQVDYDESGAVISCNVILNSLAQADTQDLCWQYPEGRRMPPTVDAVGKPIKGRVTIEAVITFAPR